jgi:hypothetical protein
MKKLILTLSVLVAGFGAGAQSIGLKGGLNVSNVIRTGDNDFSTDYKSGFHAGIFVDVPLVDRLSLSPELVYSQKGYKTVSNGGLFGDSEFSVTSNFVEVPILLKVQAAKAFSIHLGPQFSFLTSTVTEFERGDQVVRDRVEEDNDNLRKNLLGGVLGLGFDVGSKVSVNARYGLDLQKNNGDGDPEVPQYRNQVFQVGLHVKL